MYGDFIIDPNVYGEAVADALDRKNNPPKDSGGVPEDKKTQVFFALLWVSVMVTLVFVIPFVVFMGMFGWMIK